jgi:hypothetical protein
MICGFPMPQGLGAYFGKGKIMPKRSPLILIAFMCCLLLASSGCSIYTSLAQHGETTMEGHVRHLRNARVNEQSLMGDIDRVMLFHEPARTTPLRIP